MKILILSLLVSSFTLAVDKNDVKIMMQQFEEKGLLQGVDLKQAEQNLENISPQQWKQINSIVQGSSGVMRSPASNNIDSASQKVDTNSKEYQEINKKLRMILRGSN